MNKQQAKSSSKAIRHFKRKVIKSKRIYDRKNNKISY